MSKKIHTIQSSDKVEFDKEVNQFLVLGCELMDGGYQVINNNDGVVYSQVIVFKKNCEVEFYKNGQLKFVQNKNEDGKEDGLLISWYENGQKHSEGTWKDGEFVGLSTVWYENGQKKSEGTFKDGKEDGLFTSWYENGKKMYEGTYKNGKKNGLFTSWFENGQKKQEGLYKDGNLISYKYWNRDGSVKE